MAKTINAIYENGDFKPLEPISLKEHEMVVSAFINRNGYPAQVNCEGEELRGKFEFININNYELSVDITDEDWKVVYNSR